MAFAVEVDHGHTARHVRNICRSTVTNMVTMRKFYKMCEKRNVSASQSALLRSSTNIKIIVIITYK